MAWGRRCDPGCHSWPDSDDYKRCAVCGEETTRYSNLQPLDEDEAKSIKAHQEFESVYAVICRKKGISTDGPDIPSDALEDEFWDSKYPGGRPDNADILAALAKDRAAARTGKRP